MKQLHYTGKSFWSNGELITEINADFGYSLMYEGHTKRFEQLRMSTKSYEEQKDCLIKVTAVRDWRQGGNNEVQLMAFKKLNHWRLKHGYGTIES